MGLSGALLATTAATTAAKAITDIGQANAAKADSSYNSTIANLKVQALQVQNDVTQGQYMRQGGLLLSKQTAVAGAAGIEPTGSVAAVMLDSQTQINTDMAIAQFNNQLQQNYASSQATNDKNAINMAGYTNAFSDILSGANSYTMYTMGPYKKAFNTAGGASTAAGV